MYRYQDKYKGKKSIEHKVKDYSLKKYIISHAKKTVLGFPRETTTNRKYIL